MLGIFSTDWILQKTTKEENGEMTYFTGEKNNSYSIIYPQVCLKYVTRNLRHSHITLCTPSGINRLQNDKSRKIQKQYHKDIFYKMMKNIFKYF